MSCGGSSSISDRHKKNFFLEDLQRIIPGQFGFNHPSALREEPPF
jgi:hypothetical protein